MSHVITVLITASLSLFGLGISEAFSSRRNPPASGTSTDPALIEELREQLQRCGTEKLPPSCPVCAPFESPLVGYFAFFGIGIVWIAACTGSILQLSRYLANTHYTSRVDELVPEGTDLLEPCR